MVGNGKRPADHSAGRLFYQMYPNRPEDDQAALLRPATISSVTLRGTGS